MAKVPINCRGNIELRRAIEAYQARRGMENFSDAVCALLASGLSHSPTGETPPPPAQPVGEGSNAVAQAIYLLETRVNEQKVALQKVSRLLLSAILPANSQKARLDARQELQNIFGEVQE